MRMPSDAFRAAERKGNRRPLKEDALAAGRPWASVLTDQLSLIRLPQLTRLDDRTVVAGASLVIRFVPLVAAA
jgi:hypothetical protein